MSRRTGPDQATVQLVRERDEWRCVRCGAGARVSRGMLSLTTQHRQARGMGGTRRESINLPSNLLSVCGDGTRGCHGWIEHHPAEARTYGWAVASWDNPTMTPVLTWRGWLLLTDDGAFELLPDYEPEIA